MAKLKVVATALEEIPFLGIVIITPVMVSCERRPTQTLWMYSASIMTGNEFHGESTELPLCLYLGVRRQIRESILVTYGVNNLVPNSIPGGDAHTTPQESSGWQLCDLY